MRRTRGRRPQEMMGRPTPIQDKARRWLARFHDDAAHRGQMGPWAARPGQLVASLRVPSDGRGITIEAFRVTDTRTRPMGDNHATALECEGFLAVDLYEDGRSLVTYRKEWIRSAGTRGRLVPLRPGEYRALLMHAMA